MLCSMIEELGVCVYIGKNIKVIEDGEICVLKMEFVDGSYFEIDMILFFVGICLQDELVCFSGLVMGECGGIIVNNFCQILDEDVFVIGECVLWNNCIFGLVVFGY